VAPLLALLNDAKAPAFARWSAIWTLDRIDAGKAAHAAIINIAKNSSEEASVRRQAMRELGDAPCCRSDRCAGRGAQ